MSTGGAGIQESSTRQLERVRTTLRLVGGGGGAVIGGREEREKDYFLSGGVNVPRFLTHTHTTTFKSTHKMYELCILQSAMFTYQSQMWCD